MPAAIQDRPTAQAGKTPLVVRLLVLATFVVILNETLMINAIPRLMESMNARFSSMLHTSLRWYLRFTMNRSFL